MNDMARCGRRDCPNPHPLPDRRDPWTRAADPEPVGPISRRIAAIQPVPEAAVDRRPAWLRNLKPADKTEWSPR